MMAAAVTVTVAVAAPTITATQLRGVVLASGPYDIALAAHASTPASRRFIIWAYSRSRRFLHDPTFATWSVTDQLTAAFPPALIPLATPTRSGRTPSSWSSGSAPRGSSPRRFFPDDHRPPLNHEYQFNLDTSEGRRFLERLLTFLSNGSGRRGSRGHRSGTSSY
jgi:acetyl esterase